MFDSQTFLGIRSGLHFRLQAAFQKRRFGGQEKPAFTRFSVDSQQSPDGVCQSREVVEKRILAEPIGGNVEFRAAVKKEDPIVKAVAARWRRSRTALSGEAMHVVPARTIIGIIRRSRMAG